ncbi:WbqC-like protein [Saprospira grandis DSM 2844]|uniref:WbqC-like protein n=1 Tax=Saprospira grandis DSM 2844 TaxID=694433 RepID=J1I4I6_9BACT|nr:WbqC family protein [Saprospira grandis]EJF53625.1 WbqC-like protein [Saprospira grandis DSM 2844]
MRKAFICQSNYIPWKGYFEAIAQADVFVLYDCVQYTKNDWRNRNRIKTAQGLQWLTIPVRQKQLKQRIADTQVAQANWAKKHWNSWQTHYAKAPFFKQYAPQIKALYLEEDSPFLSQINKRFILWALNELQIQTKVLESVHFDLQKQDPSLRLIELLQQIDAQHYLSGPAAKAYIHEEAFEAANIKLEYLNYGPYPTYEQLYPPFSDAVSILDLFFHLGPAAKQFFRSI